MDIQDVYASHKEDIDSVTGWVNEEYQRCFEEHFAPVRGLYTRMKSASHPATDAELERILTEIPLEMFAAAEALSQYKLAKAVLKINIKKKAQDVAATSDEKTATARQAEGAAAVLDDQILESAMAVLIDRADRELELARELIMGAKKVWDGRRGAESLGMTQAPPDEIPPYSRSGSTGTPPPYHGNTTSQYIK